MADTLSRRELEAAHCWEADDNVPRQPVMTAFRRRLRYHQAQWREAKGYPIGSQPMAPPPGTSPSRLVGSRIPLAFGRETGANFLTPAALEAARARTSYVEPHQSFDHQRLWADLLSSPAMSFNLFGDLAADLSLGDHALHTWWPDTPGTVVEVRFAHSPGRLDAAYLGNLVDWDVAFIVDLGDGGRGVVAVVTPYHDVNKRQPPKPRRLPRYRAVTEASALFRPDAMDAVNGTELVHIWLEHALMLSMLQLPNSTWRWGRYAVIHPAGNVDFAEATARYRQLLADSTTFSSMTIEELLGSGVLPAATISAFRDRYVTI